MKFCTPLSLSLILVCFMSGTVNAQEPTIADHLNADGTITVIQPAALNVRLQRVVPDVNDAENGDDEHAVVVTQKVKAGYRVQVFDDNNVRTAKHEAQERKNQIESRFPEFGTYVSFNSPYWRVKVGDFATRSEAEAAMAEIRQAFPAMAKSLRIVRDRIKHQ